jgi:hypothetical protein
VDPGDGWAQTALLEEDGSPLVNPTGLAFLAPDQLLVCDTGLRHGWTEEDSDRNVRYVAEPPAVYRVDLGQVPATITRVSPATGMVWPTRIAVDRHGRVVVTDRGESLSTTTDRSWRTQPHEFGVVVHFARDRVTGDDASERFMRRRRIQHSISQVVADERPAHTLPWFKF